MALTRTTQTAFFILWMSPLPSGFSWMYICRHMGRQRSVTAHRRWQMWTHLSKNAKQGDPQDEEDEIPCPHQRKAQDEGEEVEKRRQGRKASDHLSVDLSRLVSIRPSTSSN